MVSLFELIAVAVVTSGLSTYLTLLVVDAKTSRNQRFLEHLEHRIILLQRAEFDRQVALEQEKWRQNFKESPPANLIDDVRMRFDVFPPFKQCEAEWQAILNKARK